MAIRAIKISFIFILILLGFILILLLPREMKVTVVSPFATKAEFPFSFELYQAKMTAFIDYIQTEKGFGERRGEPISKELQRLLPRSLMIIIPAFVCSMVFGVLFGVLQFLSRNSILGKFQASVSWLFSSIPDFFLYIVIQLILIKQMNRGGLPHMHIYGHDYWYSFIFPCLAITIFPLLHMAKFTASALQSQASEEYIRTAYAKGLGSSQVLRHMLWNCWPGLLNQTQVIMLYILSSLPIIEKLSSYKGAGYVLLESIQGHDDIRALAYMLPFLCLMFLTILSSQIVKHRLLPQQQ
ncbi:ABC transporter permease subunit [Peribacillus sp. SCS-155]|uniref:ABC transporter permease subunit n=1 Tax=Peribacillus sedimenti TaxID=3115297 RepID=UPI00390588D4